MTDTVRVVKEGMWWVRYRREHTLGASERKGWIEHPAYLAPDEKCRLFREALREALRSMDRRERADFADAANWYPEGEGEVLTDWEQLVLAALCPEEAPCPTD